MKTPQSAFLNETETWRGQQDKDSKCGKYLRICPDVDSIRNKPQIISKISLLQNGIFYVHKIFRNIMLC